VGGFAEQSGVEIILNSVVKGDENGADTRKHRGKKKDPTNHLI
jgi:hypothetical protein